MAIFAISVDDPGTPNRTIEQFLAAHHYTIPVLRGPEYAHAMGVGNIPTTLFIDSKGNLAFRKLGGGVHLVQEFGWRFEAMEQSAPPQVTAKRHASAKPEKTE